MMKSSALYVVVIIALVIFLVCASLIMAASIYKNDFLVKSRYDRLELNAGSGINLLLFNADTSMSLSKQLSVTGDDGDSISLRRSPWGVFDLNTVTAFEKKDSAFRAFTSAYLPDTLNWPAIYLTDADRPVSVSGNTRLSGDACLPASGINTAYIDGHYYQGNKQLVSGRQRTSARQLPALNKARLHYLESLFATGRVNASDPALSGDVVHRLFRDSLLKLSSNQPIMSLEGKKYEGHILLYADSAILIDSATKMDNVLVVARVIKIAGGFHGKCQLFATDSISIGKKCRFEYPSCIGLLRASTAAHGFIPQISIGDSSSIAGLVFVHEYGSPEQPSFLSLGKTVKISGLVYTSGILENQDGVHINGSAYTGRFMYRQGTNRYDNYLINITIDRYALTHHSLASNLMPVCTKEKKILQWLELK